MCTWNLVFHMKSGQKFSVLYDTDLKTSDDVIKYFTEVLNRGGVQSYVFKQSEKSVICITLNEVEALEVSV